MESRTIECILALCLMALVTLFSGCISRTEGDKIGVIVTLAPQREMIEAIGGDRITVTAAGSQATG